MRATADWCCRPPGNRKERIDQAIVGLSAGGSTNGGAVHRLA
jgi:hypothetical protein